ncbi:MAG: glutamine amidotransferase, partial [Halocynthiibacter sp.]
GQNVYATQFHPEAGAEVFELRIRLYRNNGYFDPEDANRLIALWRSVKVRAPELILLNFVKNYRVPA